MLFFFHLVYPIPDTDFQFSDFQRQRCQNDSRSHGAAKMTKNAVLSC